MVAAISAMTIPTVTIAAVIATIPSPAVKAAVAEANSESDIRTEIAATIGIAIAAVRIPVAVRVRAIRRVGIRSATSVDRISLYLLLDDGLAA